MTFVTFIIPSLDRDTLPRTLMSLIMQNDPDWLALVIGDGCEITNRIPDDRILYLSVAKQSSGAGIVRNFGFDFTLDSDWVAFVDDDDYLKDTYVSRIKYYSDRYDLIQFTYKDVETGRLQPPPGLNHLVECDMGISFAVRESLRRKHNIKFTPGGVEDYRFLRDCLNVGARYVITGEILYLVGHRSAWGTN